MSGLPQRFPRASLIDNAARLEFRIERLLDQVHAQMIEAEDRNMAIVERKLAARFNTLDDARAICNELRIKLWALD